MLEEGSCVDVILLFILEWRSVESSHVFRTSDLAERGMRDAKCRPLRFFAHRPDENVHSAD
jgi:hypothetical protein